MYRSFQAIGKTITLRHPLLPYIEVRCKRYILSPSERTRWEEGRYRGNSPPPFTTEDLGVTTAFPTLVERPHNQLKKKTSHAPTHSPSPPKVELDVQTAILLDNFPTKMPKKWGHTYIAPSYSNCSKDSDSSNHCPYCQCSRNYPSYSNCRSNSNSHPWN